MSQRSHQDRIREEFAKQAELFAKAPEMKDEEALRQLLCFSGAGPDDIALDVACGPGIVACSLASVAARVVGIDLTPAMIERARSLGEESGLANVSWQIGDVENLPFADRTFTLATSRYAFHHHQAPKAVLAEMRRVCRPGGRLVVVDVAASTIEAKAEAFNRMERWRDPSHVRALTLAEFHQLFAQVGLTVAATSSYRIDFDVDTLLQGSFPATGDRKGLEKLFRGSVADDTLGLGTRERDGRLVCSYPIAMLLARC